MDHFRDQNALLAQRYDKSGPKWYFNDSFHRYPEEPADLDVAARVYLDGLVLKVVAHLSDLVWHFIGPIQSNKSKFIAECFDWCHSIDRLKIAQRLNNQRAVDQKPLQVCIQVNIDNEVTKAGITPEELPAIASQIAQMPQLTLRGIMAIPKATSIITEQRDSFERLAHLYQALQTNFPDVDTLSMGMSGDIGPAIEAGSTMVRVGTGIFGQRTPSPKKD